MFRRHRSPEELPYLLHPVDRLVAVGRQGILHAAQICDGPGQLQQGGAALHRLQLRGGVEQFPHRFDLHGESSCADKLFIPNQQDELLPSGCLPDTLDLVIDPVQMARGLLLQLMGGGIQREAVAHPLGRWDRVLIENREERDGFVGDEVAHMDGGDRFRIHIFLPFHSVFGGVCCCQTRCSFAAGKAIQQTHRTFRCGFCQDQQFPMSRGRLCSADPCSNYLGTSLCGFRFSPQPAPAAG